MIYLIMVNETPKEAYLSKERAERREKELMELSDLLCEDLTTSPEISVKQLKLTDENYFQIYPKNKIL